MTAFLCIRDLHQRYGGRAILERISLDVIEGDFVAVVGASGCGKSTFLRLLLAEEQPTAGSISLDGKPPAREPGRDRGVVFQRYSVFPHMTVLGNLIAAQGLGANILGALFGRAHADAGARARAMLERIGLAHMARAYPAALSGGMQQRLAIAQALAAGPRLLLLDEPFGALDPGTRAEMHDFLLEMKDTHAMTVVMVTHDLPEAFKLADRVLVFDRLYPDDPERGARITYDFDTRDGGVPYQRAVADPDGAAVPHPQAPVDTPTPAKGAA